MANIFSNNFGGQRAWSQPVVQQQPQEQQVGQDGQQVGQQQNLQSEQAQNMPQDLLNQQVQQGQQAQDQNQTDPLAEFRKAFTMESKDQQGQANQQPAQQEQQVDFYQVDPQALQEKISTINFAQGVNPDVVEKALSGDIASFQQALNSVAQLAVTQAITASVQAMRAANEYEQQRLKKELPDFLKEFTIQDKLKSSPLLNDPAMAPIVEGLKEKLRQAYPQASAEEIARKAEEYLQGVAAKFQSQPQSSSQEQQVNQQNQQPTAQDWANWLKT